MSMVLESLHFVGMVVLNPHFAGGMIIHNVGTEREAQAIAMLREHQVALRDYHSRKVVTDIIEAFEVR